MSDVVGFTEATAKKIYDNAMKGVGLDTPSSGRIIEELFFCLIKPSEDIEPGTDTAPGEGFGVVQKLSSIGEYQNYQLPSGSSLIIPVLNTFQIAYDVDDEWILGCAKDAFTGNWYVVFDFVPRIMDLRWDSGTMKLQKTFDGVTWLDIVSGDDECPA